MIAPLLDCLQVKALLEAASTAYLTKGRVLPPLADLPGPSNER